MMFYLIAPLLHINLSYPTVNGNMLILCFLLCSLYWFVVTIPACLQVVYKLMQAMDVTHGVNAHGIFAALHAAEHLGISVDTLDLLVMIEVLCATYCGGRL